MIEEPTLDYEAIGLIAGLEVHQQLQTERKLFCHCPAGLYTKDHDGSVLRHMRPTLSELGEYDGTALMEFKTQKNIVYLLNKRNVCTYEMDDTPPFLINQDALDVAVEQCLMLGCDIVDEVHVARKQYLDGSIPTGFQRTAIVGVNGKLPFAGRHLSVVQVSVEEDSCREVSDVGHLIVWRTDRLGTPLIETVTGPDLRTPDEVVEAILLIGRVCRSTGHVRVGTGASRQDVNVSVRGGRRVEIKGVPQACWARALVHGEALRQVNLLALRDELNTRGFRTPEDLDIDHMDVTYLFENVPLPWLRRDRWERFCAKENRRPKFELGEGPFCARAIRLRGMQGVLSWPTQPEQIFAHELAGRIRVIAGLDQQPVLLHSEKWPDYEGSPQDLKKLKKRTHCGPKDALIVVWGPLQDTLTAVEEIRLRLVDAMDGVPHETRQPHEDGSTDFERILPGPERMYPDTDSPPIGMTRQRVADLAAALPPPPWVREEQYGAVGIPQETVRFLIRRGGAQLVDYVVKHGGVDLRRACYFFGERMKGLTRQGVDTTALTPTIWAALLAHIEAQPVLWQAWQQLVKAQALKPALTPSDIESELELGHPPPDWHHRVSTLCAGPGPDYDDGTQAQHLRFLMGRAMTQLRGKVDARDVAKHISSILEGAR